MEYNIKRWNPDSKAKPYEPNEMFFDGDEDIDRIMATWEKKYREEQEKLKKQGGAK